MTETNDRIEDLLRRLDILLNRQESFSAEINQLRIEILKLKNEQVKEPSAELIEKHQDTLSPKTEESAHVVLPPIPPLYQEKIPTVQNTYPGQRNFPPKIKSNTEKFIGENLINKIGIVITIIGVAVGAKYSIDHELISPLTRILLGYLVGIVLLGLGIRLRKAYTDFSAVLVSGAIAIMYLITYLAYSFYSLLPQLAAFGMMVVFTILTVMTAIRYNRQVIAHIGLVGAYAVPLLLSEGSGNVWILFSYIAIINTGILFIAIRKYWKSLYYSSFIITWSMFILWYFNEYAATEPFRLFWTFLFIFFITFYLIFLAYKLIQKEKFGAEDIIMILSNAFIFYGLGYSVLDHQVNGDKVLGLFTISNAILHLCVSAVIYRQKAADRNLFYLVAGLVLIFVTIAVPVQLDGNWVTLLWAGEALLLFSIGRTKGVAIYEKISYVLMGLAFASLIGDWWVQYEHYNPDDPLTRLTPFLNIYFISALLFAAAFGVISYINTNKKYIPANGYERDLNQLVSFSINAILLITLYYAFRMEIATYWGQLYADSVREVPQEGQEYSNWFWNEDLNGFKTVWVLNYSLLFLSILSFIDIKFIRNRTLAYVTITAGVICVIAFLTQGLYVLSVLRDSHLRHLPTDYYATNGFNISVRYISYALAGMMLWFLSDYLRQDYIRPLPYKLKVSFELFLALSILWMATAELITWMNIMEFSQSYKLGVSILWGVYALALIALGIWKNKRHLRIGAIVLFTATLLKLFVYDLSSLDTIAKTIVFVSLGVLLLTISFLYNKYKHLISGDDEPQPEGE